MKTKYKAAAAAVLLALFTALPAPAAEETRVINNQKTMLHKEFFSIPVLIAPKMGYQFVRTENGAADKNKKVSLEASLLHMPYSRLIEEIAKDGLKKGEMEVKSQYSFIWNGSNAELLKIFQQSGKTTVGKWVLIVDRGANQCWMITGSYMAKDVNAAQYVLDMIKSAWWTNETPAPVPWPLDGGVDTAGTPFRVAGFRQDALIYTKDGNIPTENPDQALFVISSIVHEYIPSEKRASFASERAVEIERGTHLEIKSQTEETVNGMPAIITVGYAGENGGTLIFQAALFRPSSVTMLVGIAKDNTAENLETFYKLAYSYKEGQR